MALTGGLGRYIPGSSPLHRADPRVKTACTAVAMAATFLVATPAQAALAVAAFLALCRLGRVSPLETLRSCRPVILMLVLVSCLNLVVTRSGPVVLAVGPLTVTEGGASWAALYSVRLTLLVLTGSLLLMTTTPVELTRAFAGLLSPLSRLGVPVESLALVLSLALRFVPTLADETEGVREAQLARGADLDRGGPARRIGALVSVLVPTLAGALRHAQGLSLALEARGYDPASRRTAWHSPKVRGGDVGLMVACGCYLALLVALGHLG